MSYKKANEILPAEVLKLVQFYIDGECLYIPRKVDNKKKWGSKTTIRKELKMRNSQIYEDYNCGLGLERLCEKYYLSLKSIQRIILQCKRKEY